MMSDFFAHTFFNDPKAAEAEFDADFDPDEVARLIGAEPDQGDGDWEELG